MRRVKNGEVLCDRTRRASYESTCTTNGLQQIGGGQGSRQHHGLLGTPRPTATKVLTAYMDQTSTATFIPRIGARIRRNSREAPGEGTIADVLDLVHHEGHSAELSPRRWPGLARLGGGDPRVLAPGGPDLARLLHPLAEVGVDLLVIRLRRHGGGMVRRKLYSAREMVGLTDGPFLGTHK